LEGFAHEGMVRMAERLVNELRTVLRGELECFPDYRLVMCGHSMGGAVSALALAKLRCEVPPWRSRSVALGVGTPGIMSRCIGEQLRSESAVITAVNNRDWSPRFSTTNVRELMDDLCQLNTFRSVVEAIGMGSVNACGDSIATPQEHQQLPPGEILQICHDDGRPSASSLGGKPPKLLSGGPADYLGTMQIWPDVDAHLPINYVRGLLEGTTAAMHIAVAREASMGMYQQKGTSGKENELASEGCDGCGVPAALHRIASMRGSQPCLPSDRDAVQSLLTELKPLFAAAGKSSAAPHSNGELPQ